MKPALPVIIGVLIIAIAGIGAAGYFYYQYQKTQAEITSIKNDPNILKQAAGDEVKRLVEEVGKLIALPEGEQPTVATITDIEKLKDQPFFAKAKNGDKVLIYTNAKKAILYDPNTKKILDVESVNIGSPSATLNQSKVFLRTSLTATDSAGLANRIETDIKRTFPQASVVGRDSLSRTEYNKTLVVYLVDTAKSSAESLAKALNVSLSATLPPGETKPQGAEILVIIGKDKL